MANQCANQCVNFVNMYLNVKSCVYAGSFNDINLGEIFLHSLPCFLFLLNVIILLYFQWYFSRRANLLCWKIVLSELFSTQRHTDIFLHNAKVCYQNSSFIFFLFYYFCFLYKKESQMCCRHTAHTPILYLHILRYTDDVLNYNIYTKLN